MYKSFIINKSCDAGRLFYINKIKNILNSEMYIVPHNRLVNRNTVLSRIDQQKEIFATKMAFMDIIKRSRKMEYIFLFYGDFIVDTNIESLFNILLKRIKILSKWKLIYLGVTDNVNFADNNYLTNLSNCKFDKIVFDGVCGVAIHNSAFDILLNRLSMDEFRYSTFDISCLGYLQIKYKHECYVTNPMIVSPINNDVLKNCLPMYILVKDNVQRTNKILDMVRWFRPIYYPILIHLDMPKYEMHKYLKKINVLYKIVENVSELYDFIMKNSVDYDHYIITNFYINWTINGDDMNTQINAKINETVDVLKMEINRCPHCMQYETSNNLSNNVTNKIDTHIDLLSGFTIVKKNVDLTTDIICKQINLENRLFYYNTSCNDQFKEYHHIYIDDILSGLDISVLHYNQFWYNILKYTYNVDIYTISHLNQCIKKIFYNIVMSFLNKWDIVMKDMSDLSLISVEDEINNTLYVLKSEKTKFEKINLSCEWTCDNTMILNYTYIDLLKTKHYAHYEISKIILFIEELHKKYDRIVPQYKMDVIFS